MSIGEAIKGSRHAIRQNGVQGWLHYLLLALWIVVLPLSLYHLSIVARTSIPTNGIGLYGLHPFDDPKPFIVQFATSAEASKAGVRTGDRLLSLNGKPVDNSNFFAVLDAIGRPGEVRARFADMHGRERDVTLTRNPHHYDDLSIGKSPPYATFVWLSNVMLHSLFSIYLIFLGVVLAIKRPKDDLALTASLWLLLASGWRIPLLAHLPTVSIGIDIVQSWMMFLVLAIFPSGSFRPWWTSAVLVLLMPLAYVENHDVSRSTYLALNYGGMLIALLPTMARFRATPRGAVRQQIRWALFGFGLAMLLYLAELALFAASANATDAAAWIWLVLASSVAALASYGALGTFLTVGLVRYRLYDAEAAIGRSVAYGTITVGLLAVFAGSEKIVEVLGEEYFGRDLGTLAGVLGAATAAVVIGPLHHRVMHWAKHRFQSSVAHLRAGLPTLVGDLRETATPKALARTVLARIGKELHATRGAIIMDGKVIDILDVDTVAVTDWLTQNRLLQPTHRALHYERGDAVFPVRIALTTLDDGTTGWLLLGPRPDRSLFGREERLALETIAEPVGRALLVAIDRNKRELAHTREISALRQLIQRVQERMDRWEAGSLTS